MTRRERVKAAIAHKTPDKVPVFIHMAPDGLTVYHDALWERYGREDMCRLRDESKIEYRNALYYSMGNHVCFLENHPWRWGGSFRPRTARRKHPTSCPRRWIAEATRILPHPCAT